MCRGESPGQCNIVACLPRIAVAGHQQQWIVAVGDAELVDPEAEPYFAGIGNACGDVAAHKQVVVVADVDLGEVRKGKGHYIGRLQAFRPDVSACKGELQPWPWRYFHHLQCEHLLHIAEVVAVDVAFIGVSLVGVVEGGANEHAVTQPRYGCNDHIQPRHAACRGREEQVVVAVAPGAAVVVEAYAQGIVPPAAAHLGMVEHHCGEVALQWIALTRRGIHIHMGIHGFVIVEVGMCRVSDVAVGKVYGAVFNIRLKEAVGGEALYGEAQGTEDREV